ncbi:hypothetical protein VNO77_18543 [Canavalia gladiata]|uniref:Uncharacterized protein n=1 Tax=Canavalia gladiata TaxID=3824 RepID=A0AAN9LL54_CANGL
MECDSLSIGRSSANCFNTDQPIICSSLLGIGWLPVFLPMFCPRYFHLVDVGDVLFYKFAIAHGILSMN